MKVELSIDAKAYVERRDRDLYVVIDDGVDSVQFLVPKATEPEPFPYMSVKGLAARISAVAWQVRRESLDHLPQIAT